MTRIETTLKTLDRTALITFITACDPDYDTSLQMLKSLPKNGADIIELGMPFSDPMADGPTIQAASQRALATGGDMNKTLQMVEDFRQDNQDTPLILMGYYNPILQYGLETFAETASKAGVDGLIIVDIPPEESADLKAAAQKHNLDIIRLITPTTDEKRLPTVLEGASGFLYYVSITGVTGTAKADIKAVQSHISAIKQSTDLPIAIGFGIKTPEDAAEMGQIADGIVVGSSIVETLCTQGISASNDLVSSLSKALRT